MNKECISILGLTLGEGLVCRYGVKPYLQEPPRSTQGLDRDFDEAMPVLLLHFEDSRLPASNSPPTRAQLFLQGFNLCAQFVG